MSSNKKTYWFWMIILIISLIALYVISLGKVDGSSFNVPKEFKDNEDEAKNRHKQLKTEIDKDSAKSIKYKRKFKRTYFSIRLAFVLLWFLYIYLLVIFKLVNNLEDALNYSEVAILVWIVFNFLTFGTISKLNSFFDLIRTRLENLIWGKDIRIDEDINQKKKELKQIEQGVFDDMAKGMIN